MKKQDYTASITVNATAHEVFKNINSVRNWLTEDWEGNAKKVNDEFTVHFGETFITLKVVELVPDKKIVWQVTDCYKHWLKDKKEWKGTTISWEIVAGKNETEINFTHLGLVPGIECYKGCAGAWDFYIKESLYKLITEQKGEPELK